MSNLSGNDQVFDILEHPLALHSAGWDNKMYLIQRGYFPGFTGEETIMIEWRTDKNDNG